jgi:hypothetical protein
MDPLPENVPKKRAVRQKRVKKQINSPDYVKARMSSPEMLAKRMEGLRKWREANPGKRGRPHGLQDGVGLKKYLKRLEVAKAKSERAIKVMAEQNLWKADNDVASKAMQTAIEIMLSQEGTTQNRLAAAKTILDFTQTRPTTKSETTLKSAEEFLSSLIDDKE